MKDRSAKEITWLIKTKIEFLILTRITLQPYTVSDLYMEYRCIGYRSAL